MRRALLHTHIAILLALVLGLFSLLCISSTVVFSSMVHHAHGGAAFEEHLNHLQALGTAVMSAIVVFEIFAVAVFFLWFSDIFSGYVRSAVPRAAHGPPHRKQLKRILDTLRSPPVSL